MSCNEVNVDPHFEGGLERAGLAVVIAKPGLSGLKQSHFSNVIARASQ